MSSLRLLKKNSVAALECAQMCAHCPPRQGRVALLQPIQQRSMLPISKLHAGGKMKALVNQLLQPLLDVLEKLRKNFVLARRGNSYMKAQIEIAKVLAAFAD